MTNIENKIQSQDSMADDELIAEQELSDMIKLEKIDEKIEEFKETVKENFTAADSKRIFHALDLMLELHIDQQDRRAGSPYASHPLRVATDIINKYNIYDKDLVISALLHDSIEDQSYKMYEKLMRKKLGRELNKEENLAASKKKHREKIKEAAVDEVGSRYGDRVKTIVEKLSNLDFEALIQQFKQQGINKTEYDLYKEHVAEIVEDSDVCAVKYADFSQNALGLDNLSDGPKKTHLRKKYGPVIREVFQPLFKNLSPEHPLFDKKEDILAELEKTYKEQYNAHL